MTSSLLKPRDLTRIKPSSLGDATATILNGEYGCRLTAPELAKICQYAENTYFGKPSGLLDQLTSAVGGVIFADFADPKKPRIEKIHTAGLLPADMTLCVTDTRGSHSELTGEFAAIPISKAAELESPLPRSTSLGGNHTDHQHGYGLAVAVTLDLVAVASPSDDGFIRV